MRVDPIRLEVFHHLLAAICEESGALLQRSAISPNIRERRDFSCALFDADGELVAQAAHIPVHLGSAADSVAAVRRDLALEPGDVAILNDPFAGGTHLPDVTVVRPVFLGSARRPSWYLANRAHHADVGGAVPGSMGVARELLAEGLVIPPLLLRRRGEPNASFLRLLRANVRGPDERLADLQAQEAALQLAERRLLELCDRYGARTVTAYARHLMDYSERIARSVLRDVRPGTYSARARLDGDGTGGGPFELRLGLHLTPARVTFDFRGTSPQASGGVNANRSIVLAACVYVLRCLCPTRLPTNGGLFRVLRVVTERGSLLEPHPGAAVAGGNVETSQRLVDLCLAALARAVPEAIPAASCGTMSNLSLGGQAFAFYETLPGGAGAGPHGPGTAAVQTHMTNTRNTPVEEMERRWPLRVRRLTLRRGSGGQGRHAGGDGIVKELELLAPAAVTLFAERHESRPPGLAGGDDGAPGAARVVHARRGRSERVPAKGTHRLEAGDRFVVETPGGGGWGRARRRR